ncbi:MAG: amino acid ABC transporter permease [Chthoniobacterales bacterium]|nr:amino acid ABC transporter permease [Chthoniobacterales bacterium]
MIRTNNSPSILSLNIFIFTGLSLLSFSFFFFVAGSTHTAFQWETIWHYRRVFWQGWVETILIATAALFFSILLGSLIVMARRSVFWCLRILSLTFIELIRGTPLLTQILFFFYVIAHGIGLENRLIAGIAILSLFSSAYLSEIIRGGIEMIPLAQWESAKILGLTRFQTYRYVVLPQVLRHLSPALTGQFASLIKDSSLLSIIGIKEFTMAAQQVNATTYCTLESYFPLACGYLLLTLPLSIGSRRLEKKWAL